MNYCVSARQPISILKKADEIKLQWQDREMLPQLIIDIPKKKIILEVPYGGVVPYKTIKSFIEEGANIVLQLEDLRNGEECFKFDIPFYFSQILTSFWDINNAVDQGVSELRIGGVLFFDLDAIKKFNLPVRTTANLATPLTINYSKDNGVKGTYIRPEDVEYYEEIITTLEFYSENLKQEETLLKIYREDQHWPGNLTKIIENLKMDVDNRGLPEEFGQIRMNCRQKCMRNKTCRFCDTAFLFSRQLDKTVLEINE